MSKVVYLLGAGASFGTREKGFGSPIISGLPIVCEIKDLFTARAIDLI